MPINVIGNSSNNYENEIDTSLFVQKPYLRLNYIESNIEEDIDLKGQNRIKNLPHPVSIQEAASNNYFYAAIVLGVNATLLLRFNPNCMSKLDERDYIILDSTKTSPETTLEITTKNYVDNKFNDPSLFRNSVHVEFNDKNLDNVRFIKVNSFPSIPEHLTAKIYVNQALSNSLDEPSLL